MLVVVVVVCADSYTVDRETERKQETEREKELKVVNTKPFQIGNRVFSLFDSM